MDAQLHFKVSNQLIKRVDSFKPIAKSKNYLYAYFEFLSSEWAELIVTVIFKKGDDAYEVILGTDKTCLVPWELLTEPGTIYVSCFAGSLITTDESRVTVYKTGYQDDLDSSEPPTPSVYEQILHGLENIDGGLFTDWRDD